MGLDNWGKGNRWVRSSQGWVAGVCQGLGERFGVDPLILRVIWLASVFFAGVGLVLYPMLAFTLPREDQLSSHQRKKILGVCDQLSQRSGLDIGLVRFLAVALALSSLGVTVIGYLILYFVMPINSLPGKAHPLPNRVTSSAGIDK